MRQAKEGGNLFLKKDTIVSVNESNEYDFFQRLIYGSSATFYDLLAWRFFLIFGPNAGREFIAAQGDFRPGQRVVSLGCGTGMQERRIAKRLLPGGELIGIDSGRALIRRATKLNRSSHVRYVRGDARQTGLPAGSFDRVLICFALHEMPRNMRAAVLTEAFRLLTEDGLLVVADHRIPVSRWMRLLQRVWWLYWFPGNSEKKNAWDMLHRGLDTEIAEAGFSLLRRTPFPKDNIMEVFVAGKPASA